MDVKRRRAMAILAASICGNGPMALAQNNPRPGSREQRRDLVVIIPGIGGSVLSVRGKPVWSPSVSGLGKALITLGGSLSDLRLTEDSGSSLGTDDGVTADSLVPDLHIIPGLWKIDGYSEIVKSLRSSPGAILGENLFAFPYDWRRDNRVAARLLAQSCHGWLRRWREQSGQSDAKIAFVAHSMGGIIARYFIECLEGWKTTSSLITIGTPYRGSLNAVDTLHHGTRIFGSLNLPKVGEFLRSCTSVHQLLPTYPCIGVDGSVKRISEVASLRGIDAGRARDGLAFHREIEAAVANNVTNPAYLANRYRIHPVVGISQRTLQYGELKDSNIVLSYAFPGMQVDGDGTVPFPSATPLELEGKYAELYVAEVHGSLQNSEFVLNQIRGLASAVATDWSKFRYPPQGATLTVPFAALLDVPIEISGKANPANYEKAVQLTVFDASSGVLIKEWKHQCDQHGEFMVRLPRLLPSSYRVSATFSKMPLSETESVSDTFVILPS